MQHELSAQSQTQAELSGPIKLGSDLGIEHIQTLHDELMKHIDDPADVELDVSDVERVHTAALQLFCLFCRDRRAAGRGVALQKPTEALRSAAALLGATTLLNLAKVNHESGQ
jgi:ABC-type transporter Mla MlaB component